MVTLFADAALARRLELNKSTAAVEYARAQERLRPGTTAVLPIAGGNAVFVGTTSPISRVMGLGMQEPLTAGDLDTVEEFFRDHGLAPRLELCPLADRSVHLLTGDRRYRIDHFRNVMVRPLSPGEILPEVASGASINRVHTPEEKQEWLFTIARGFLEKDDVVPEETWISQPMTQVPAVSCYIARLGDEPVGGGAMAIRGGLAYLSSTSVLPAYRGRGMQSALLWVRLNDAIEAGCDMVMVETAPGSPSQRNLERFGFCVAYTTMAVVRD
ncbi:MAG: GNAT family N-acetyltransferase [Bacillota bacterium]